MYFQVVATCCYSLSHLKLFFVSMSEQRLTSSVRIVLSFRLCLLDVLCLLARPSVCAGVHCARACVAPAAVSFWFMYTRWLQKDLGFLKCTRKTRHVALDVLVARNTVRHAALDVLAARNIVGHVSLDSLACTKHGFCDMHSEGWTCCPGRAGCPKHGGICCIGRVGCTKVVFLTCARKVGHVALDVLVARNMVGHVALNPHFCGMKDIRLADSIVFPAESRSCDLTPRINDVWPFEFRPTTCNFLLAKGFACSCVMPALYLFLSRGYGCDACKQFRGFFHCARLVAALYL